MESRKRELLDELERYYRGCGWKVERASDGTVRAVGTGGVTWIGMAVVPADLADDHFAPRLLELSDVREIDGARCPFELLPEPDCAGDLKSLLAELRLTDRISVYSLAA